MQTTFLNASGVVLFTRDDMETGEWTKEEFTVNATFPLDPDKKIERGQRMSFRNPATDALEFFEIRNVQNFDADAYQQIIAEHIAISELTDEHINTTEIASKTALQALTTVLTGTTWAAGNSTASGTSDADISRGSVWQAVCQIQQNWNVYIVPRVTVNSSGAITGKYLDITPATGTAFRGVRLSIDKNLNDPCVTYDDSETFTALYGYGGNVENNGQTSELTFKDVTWTATAEHPAKPSGQLYLEDPAKTALYGRNGRPRYGYYQNGEITDAETLLQKTWEALQQTSTPKVSIDGTVVDLYRLGYADQPIDLHDIAIVEVDGVVTQKQIIRLTVDLIDPTATRPTIGDYIPNIIYINRDIAEKVTGGGNARGKDNAETYQYNTFATLEKDTNELGSKVGMVVGTYDGQNYIKAGEIALSINESTGETAALINATHVLVSGSTVLTTALEEIRSEVHSADSQIYSVIRQTASSIMQTVNDDVNGLHTEILQTSSAIMSSVYASNSQIYSYVNQTASSIRSEVASAESDIYTAIIQTSSGLQIQINRKAAVYFGMTDPATVSGNTVQNGDFWIESNAIDNYTDAQALTWSQLGQYAYLDYFGANIYNRQNGVWKICGGDQLSNLDYSYIEINQTELKSVKGDLSGLYSQFTQEKGQIRSIVKDTANGLNSEILQTSSEIMLAVRNTQSQLEASIDVQADRISLVVQGTGSNAHIKPASIVASINAQTGTSAVRISANMVNIDGNVNLSDAMSVDGNGYILMKKYTFFNQQALFNGGISLFDGSSAYGMTGATLASTIKTASVSGSTLTLTNYAGSTINFSKATTLNASWSGSVLTIKAQQNNNGTTTDVATNTIGLGGSSYGTHTIDLAMTQNGTPSLVSGSNILVPVKIVQQQGGGATTDRATTNLQYSIASLLTTGSWTTSGTRTPGSGYVGFSSVTFTIPNASGFTKNATSYNTANSNQVGSVSKSGLTANSYMYWTVGGKKYHIVVNA